MLNLSSTTRIYVFAAITDMRKSIGGLSLLVKQYFNDELLSGSLFVFCNRHRNRVKILYWDNDGFVLWYKRLEKGKFQFCQSGPNYTVERKQLLMLLEGITPAHYDRRFKLKN